ncbi:MAG: phosphotransferase [Clostridiales bacterium]|nr:phosphotransferase [Clostridiales bacterium]
MHDRGLGVLEQYGLTAKSVIRGRGALICDTEQGMKTIREYWGSPRKMEQQRHLQLHCREAGFALVDLVLENQEGQVVTTGEEGVPYVVRDWFYGRECDTRSAEDVCKSVAALADLHKVMQMEREETSMQGDLIEECRKHNRELRRIRKFLQKKRKKNEFEEKLAASISHFLEQGEETVRKLEDSDYYRLRQEQKNSICHGECNQHNILFTREGIAFTNFEHWSYELQTADLYQFMRKILEKHCWDLRIGREMLKAYERRKPLSEAEILNLKLQLSYPWKYWKIANFYTNSNKVWISQKNTEKLEQTIKQLEPWKAFLEKL